MVELNTNTLAVLVGGLYCTHNDVSAMAIPESLWLSIAEKLTYFIENGLWDFSKLSFEEFVQHDIFIYPTEALDGETLKDMMEIPLYWETSNGNVNLSVSLDIREINNVG